MTFLRLPDTLHISENRIIKFKMCLIMTADLATQTHRWICLHVPYANRLQKQWTCTSVQLVSFKQLSRSAVPAYFHTGPCCRACCSLDREDDCSWDCRTCQNELNPRSCEVIYMKLCYRIHLLAALHLVSKWSCWLTLRVSQICMNSKILSD